MNIGKVIEETVVVPNELVETVDELEEPTNPERTADQETKQVEERASA
jgi:hypothetical protein